MPTTTPRRPARPFGYGLFCLECDALLAPDDWHAYCPAGPLCPECRREDGAELSGVLASLPPLSGGSDAATAEVEVHAGDDFCSDCDAFHEPAPALTPGDCGFYAAFSGAPRSDAPKGADRGGWLEGYDECVAQRGDRPKRGPDSYDRAYAVALSAVLSTRRPVSPPKGLGGVERQGFEDGADAGLAELHRRLMDEAMRAEVDAEMAVGF